jgi:ATP-dependent Clp protease, protease subunit
MHLFRILGVLPKLHAPTYSYNSHFHKEPTHMENLGLEFKKYATKHRGIPTTAVESYMSITAMTPNIIEERQLNIAVMDVFSRLMVDRIIFLGYPIDDQVSNIVMAQLLFLQSADPKKDVSIYINSPGGSVYAGMGIYDTMQFITPDVATVCTGLAASMGAVLLTAGVKGKRAALPHSRIMIHQPLGGIQGQATDIEITAKQILIIKKELTQILADSSGQPYDKVAADCERDYWMIAQEAKDYGLIDDVLIRKKD